MPDLRVDLSCRVFDHWTPSKSKCRKWLRCAVKHAGFTPPSRVSVLFVGMQEAAELKQRYQDEPGGTKKAAKGAAKKTAETVPQKKPVSKKKSMPDGKPQDCATNVLSFPAGVPRQTVESLGYMPLGDIVMCPEVVAREVEEQGKKKLRAHWAHLIIHGGLHLIGHDHKNAATAKAMEAIEVQSLQELGFPDPYSPPEEPSAPQEPSASEEPTADSAPQEAAKDV